MQLVKGDTGKRGAAPAPPPANPETLPACPGWLCAPARAEWKRVVPLLSDRGHLDGIDFAKLASYCEAFGQVQVCTAVVKRDGAFYRTSTGMRREHPASKAKREWMAQLSGLAAEFGLSPADRRRVPPAKPKSENRLHGLMGGKKA